jgi:hypothetical protein
METNAQEPSIEKEALLIDYMVKNKTTIKDAVSMMARKYKNKKEWYAASLRLRGLLKIKNDE